MDGFITLRGGEIVPLTNKEYNHFREIYDNAKAGSILIPLNGYRSVAKFKVEEVNYGAEIQQDKVFDTLRVGYGTFENNKIQHDVQNGLEYKDILEERTAVELLVGENYARGIITKMIDNFEKFTTELQQHLKKPSLIYKNYKELCSYMANNILRKSWEDENRKICFEKEIEDSEFQGIKSLLRKRLKILSENNN